MGVYSAVEKANAAINAGLRNVGDTTLKKERAVFNKAIDKALDKKYGASA